MRAQGGEGAPAGAGPMGGLGGRWRTAEPWQSAGELAPLRGNPESRDDGNAMETLDGLLSRPLGPFTRDWEFKWRESGFLVGGRRKREGEVDWAPRVMGRGCGYRWKPGGACRLHQSFFQQTQSVCHGPGTQPDLPAKVRVSGTFPPERKGAIQRHRLRHWGETRHERKRAPLLAAGLPAHFAWLFSRLTRAPAMGIMVFIFRH